MFHLPPFCLSRASSAGSSRGRVIYLGERTRQANRGRILPGGGAAKAAKVNQATGRVKALLVLRLSERFPPRRSRWALVDAEAVVHGALGERVCVLHVE